MKRNRVLGELTVIAAVQFVLIMIVSEALYPRYSVSSNYISDLGVGATSILFNPSVAFLGLSTILVGLKAEGLRRTERIALTLAGVGALGVGLFPETTGMPHLISALLAFLFGGLSAVLTSRLKEPVWTALGLMSLVSLALFLLRVYGPLGPGGLERMIVYPVLLWAISFGTRLTQGTS